MLLEDDLLRDDDQADDRAQVGGGYRLPRYSLSRDRKGAASLFPAVVVGSYGSLWFALLCGFELRCLAWFAAEGGDLWVVPGCSVGYTPTISLF